MPYDPNQHRPNFWPRIAISVLLVTLASVLAMELLLHDFPVTQPTQPISTADLLQTLETLPIVDFDLPEPSPVALLAEPDAACW